MPRLVYILAASHSGSTLLAMLVGAHRDTCSVGELKATSLGDVNKYPCSCGALLKECGFWQDVSRRMQHRGISFAMADARTDYRSGGTWYTQRLLQPLCRGPALETVRDAALSFSPDWRRRLPELHRRNTALVESVCEITGARSIVDSSKVALRLKYLLQIPELEVKIIRLIRDGRAVALTYLDPFGYASTEDLRANGKPRQRRLSMKEAAYRWRRSNEEAEHLLAQIDRDKWIEVRYEEYCTEREVTLRGVFEFLDLDPASVRDDFRAGEHHVIGNDMRKDTSSTVTLDERWREALTTDDRREFDGVAGRMNRRYGYR